MKSLNTNNGWFIEKFESFDKRHLVQAIDADGSYVGTITAFYAVDDDGHEISSPYVYAIDAYEAALDGGMQSKLFTNRDNVDIGEHVS